MTIQELNSEIKQIEIDLFDNVSNYFSAVHDTGDSEKIKVFIHDAIKLTQSKTTKYINHD